MTPFAFNRARQKLGLTQAQAARVLGYGAATRIYEIERGARNPSASVARLMKAYLDGYRPEDWPLKEENAA